MINSVYGYKKNNGPGFSSLGVHPSLRNTELGKVLDETIQSIPTSKMFVKSTRTHKLIDLNNSETEILIGEEKVNGASYFFLEGTKINGNNTETLRFPYHAGNTQLIRRYWEYIDNAGGKGFCRGISVLLKDSLIEFQAMKRNLEKKLHLVKQPKF